MVTGSWEPHWGLPHSPGRVVQSSLPPAQCPALFSPDPLWGLSCVFDALNANTMGRMVPMAGTTVHRRPRCFGDPLWPVSEATGLCPSHRCRSGQCLPCWGLCFQNPSEIFLKKPFHWSLVSTESRNREPLQPACEDHKAKTPHRLGLQSPLSFECGLPALY